MHGGEKPRDHRVGYVQNGKRYFPFVERAMPMLGKECVTTESERSLKELVVRLIRILRVEGEGDEGLE